MLLKLIEIFIRFSVRTQRMSNILMNKYLNLSHHTDGGCSPFLKTCQCPYFVKDFQVKFLLVDFDLHKFYMRPRMNWFWYLVSYVWTLFRSSWRYFDPNKWTCWRIFIIQSSSSYRDRAGQKCGVEFGQIRFWGGTPPRRGKFFVNILFNSRKRMFTVSQRKVSKYVYKYMHR